jgi:HEAT repeat protein
VTDLIRGLSLPSVVARVRSARELGKLGLLAKDAFPALLNATNDPEQNVREAAVHALGTFGSAAVPALMDLLQHPDKYVRRNAVWTLSKLGPLAKSALFPLCQSLQDPDPRTASGAAQALGNLGELGAPAIPALIEAMRGTNVVLCRLAAKALSQIGKPAIPMLLTQLKHHDPFVRGEAAVALGWIGPDAEPAVQDLIDLLYLGRQGSPHRTRRTTKHYSDTITPVAVPVATTDQATLDAVRGHAAQALGRIGPAALDAVPELVSALEDSCEQVRQYAEVAIRQIQRDE